MNDDSSAFRGAVIFFDFFYKKCYTFWIIWHIRYNRLKCRTEYSHIVYFSNARFA